MEINRTLLGTWVRNRINGEISEFLHIIWLLDFHLMLRFTIWTWVSFSSSGTFYAKKAKFLNVFSYNKVIVGSHKGSKKYSRERYCTLVCILLSGVKLPKLMLIKWKKRKKKKVIEWLLCWDCALAKEMGVKIIKNTSTRDWEQRQVGFAIVCVMWSRKLGLGVFLERRMKRERRKVASWSQEKMLKWELHLVAPAPHPN